MEQEQVHEREQDQHDLDQIDEDYSRYEKEAAEREARIAGKVKLVLAGVIPLTHYDAGSYWVEIVDEQTAWLATQLSHTAIAHYYARELDMEEGEHVRRWFFLVSDKDGAPYSPACLCVVPEGIAPKSNMTASCHTVGFANARAYPDFAPQIEHLTAITGLPITPNYAGSPLVA
jgi:hypothetical protein